MPFELWYVNITNLTFFARFCAILYQEWLTTYKSIVSWNFQLMIIFISWIWWVVWSGVWKCQQLVLSNEYWHLFVIQLIVPRFARQQSWWFLTVALMVPEACLWCLCVFPCLGFCLISRQPSIRFLNHFFSWKLRSIRKY